MAGAVVNCSLEQRRRQTIVYLRACQTAIHSCTLQACTFTGTCLMSDDVSFFPSIVAVLPGTTPSVARALAGAGIDCSMRLSFTRTAVCPRACQTAIYSVCHTCVHLAFVHLTERAPHVCEPC